MHSILDLCVGKTEEPFTEIKLQIILCSLLERQRKMRVCAQLQLIASLLVAVVMDQGANAFTVAGAKKVHLPISLGALPEKVEVCGFKDCRRAGGGAKLEKLINTVSRTESSLAAVMFECVAGVHRFSISNYMNEISVSSMMKIST